MSHGHLLPRIRYLATFYMHVDNDLGSPSMMCVERATLCTETRWAIDIDETDSQHSQFSCFLHVGTYLGRVDAGSKPRIQALA
jgi:hypothetical protein